MVAWLVVVVGCSDTGLSPVGAASAEFPAPAEAEGSDCGVFAFCWDAPLQGELRIEGEFSNAEGVVVLPWSLAEEQWSDGWTVCAEYPVCGDEAYFRGEGIANVDADDGDDAWSCTLTDDGFAFTGEVYFWLGEEELLPETVADPSSAGCGVGTSLR